MITVNMVRARLACKTMVDMSLHCEHGKSACPLNSVLGGHLKGVEEVAGKGAEGATRKG